MPTSAVDTYTLNRIDPAINAEEPMKSIVHVGFVASQTLAKGTVLGMVTATGLFKAYANGNSDGSETARGILQYSITVDGSNNVSINGQTVTRKSAPMYTEGFYRSEDLTGMDAAGLADLQGRLVTGDLTTGLIHF